jgi:hypothetical protein
MTSLDTAKNGLELIEGIVYVGRDACERPHGLGSCVVLRFGHLSRYTGVIIFQEFVERLPSCVRQPPVTSEMISWEMTRSQSGWRARRGSVCRLNPFGYRIHYARDILQVSESDPAWRNRASVEHDAIRRAER